VKLENRRRVMRTGTLLAVILIVLGAISLAYQGITYTTHKKVLDIGPIQATKEEHKTIPLPPIVGGVALLAGLVLLFGDSKNA
jgi:hypothetical protein